MLTWPAQNPGFISSLAEGKGKRGKGEGLGQREVKERKKEKGDSPLSELGEGQTHLPSLGSLQEACSLPSWAWYAVSRGGFSRTQSGGGCQAKAWLWQSLLWLRDQRLPGGRRGQASGAAATQMSRPAALGSLPASRFP